MLELFEATGKNRRLLATLENIAKSQRQFHAYIFSLDEGGLNPQKREIAKAFIQSVLIAEGACEHCHKVDSENFEDLTMIRKDDKENTLPKSKIEAMQDFLRRVPLICDKKFAIIENADTLREDTQNYLLKMIEEPTPGSIIVMLCDNHDRLIETVRSRAMLFAFDPFTPPAYMRLEKEAAALIAIVLKGSPFYQLNEYILENIKDRERALEIIECAEVIAGDYLCGRREGEFARRDAVRQRLYRLITALEESKRSIKSNTKPEYALKKAILDVHGF